MHVGELLRQSKASGDSKYLVGADAALPSIKPLAVLQSQLGHSEKSADGTPRCNQQLNEYPAAASVVVDTSFEYN